MWLPFVVVAGLSGEWAVLKRILMLPGAVPVMLISGPRLREIYCYFASAFMTAAVIAIGTVLTTSRPKVLRRVLVAGLGVFCSMAFLLFLMIRA